MEILVFAVLVFFGMVLFLRRSRTTGSGTDAYVHGSEDSLPVEDYESLRAAQWPGPGGPVKGSGGGNVQGGG